MYVFLAPQEAKPLTILNHLGALNSWNYIAQILGTIPELEGVRKYYLGFERPNLDSWELIEPGDLILLHDAGSIVAAGYVALKRESETLSRVIWSHSSMLKPYILILRNVGGASLQIAKLSASIGNLEQKSLTYLTQSQVARLEKEYESTANFISLITEGIPVTEQAANKMEPDEIKSPSTTQEKGSAYKLQYGKVSVTYRPEAISTISDMIELEAAAVSPQAEIATDLRDDQVEEIQRIAKLFETATAKDLTSLDSITRNKSVDQVILSYSARNSHKAPEIVNMQITKLKRDLGIVRALKSLYDDKCQICGFRIRTPNGSYYSEAAHIVPVSSGQKGVDTAGNMLILCPNHHKMLDYGLMQINTVRECTIEGVRTPINYIDVNNIGPQKKKAIKSTFQESVRPQILDKYGNFILSGTEISPGLSQARINAAAEHVRSNSSNWPRGRGRK